MKSGFYICDSCGQESSDTPEEIAEAEMKKNFGEDCKKEDCAQICDDCYAKFMISRRGYSVN